VFAFEVGIGFSIFFGIFKAGLTFGIGIFRYCNNSIGILYFSMFA